MDWIIYIDDAVSLSTSTDIATGTLNANSLTIQGNPGAVSPTLSYTTDKVIYVTGNDSVAKTIIFKDVTITGGNAENGAGIHIKAPKATVILDDGAVVTNNTAVKKGGGVYVESGNLVLKGTASITNNTARYGGGVFNAGIFEILGGTITDNHAIQDGTTLKGGFGGGVYNIKSLTHSGIASPMITSNDARDKAGGIYCSNGNTVTDALTISNSNTAAQGAGDNLNYLEGVDMSAYD